MRLEPVVQGSVDARLPAIALGAESPDHLGRQTDRDALFCHRRFETPTQLGPQRCRKRVKADGPPEHLYVKFIGTHAEYDAIDAETVGVEH